MFPSLLLVEGNIASGKTTFCKKVHAEHPGLTILHTERISPTLLRMFYADPGRYAFALQLVQQQHRVAILENVVDCTTTIFDRSIIGDWAFAAWNRACGNLTADEWLAYTEQAGGRTLEAVLRTVFHHLAAGPKALLGGAQPTQQLPQVVYMRDKPEACFERAKARAGGAQVADEQYFCGLHAAHELAMHHASAAGLAVVQIDWHDHAASGKRADEVLAAARPFSMQQQDFLSGNAAVFQRLRVLFGDL